ncbi:TPA: T9SS type A sorting domain-containing protein [Candidatus Poribacteria bacterium]|nr:T9SS type A sorting domain-containing protein [Candidatus Poribacteria bacterium]
MVIKLNTYIFVAILAISSSAFCDEFINKTEIANLAGSEVNNGIAFADYDNDGDLDLYVSADPSDLLYRNNSDGTFTEVAIESGISFVGDGVGIAFGDYDNDGDLDIYIPVNDGADVFFQNDGKGIFKDITKGVRIDNLARARSASFADFDRDGYLDIYVVNEDMPNILYKNINGKYFVDVAPKMGVADAGPGRCGIWGDYDNDGDLDLYVTNKGASNILYQNEGNGFKDVTNFAGVSADDESTGAVFADYDNDGYLDICVGGYKKVFLFHNNGNGTFTDLSEIVGIENSGTNCTPAFGDFNNDGYLDLYLAVWKGKSVIYYNNGNGTFRDVTDELEMGNFGNSWSAISGDYDKDGDLDIYVSFTTRSNILYENQGNKNNWLQVKTIGSLSNRDGIGTRIKVTADGKIQIREISGGTAYGSQDSFIAHFGLGEKTKVDMVEVFWQSGVKTRLKNISANQMIVVKENLSAVDPSEEDKFVLNNPKSMPNITCLLNNYPNPFNPETWIPFQLSSQSDVEIIIYNQNGQIVRTLSLGNKKAGIYTSKSDSAYWDGRNEEGEIVAGGIYFYLLKAGDLKDIKKMTMRK